MHGLRGCSAPVLPCPAVLEQHRALSQVIPAVLEPGAGMAPSPALLPGRDLALCSHGSSSFISLCFQPLLTHWNILNSSKTDWEKDTTKGCVWLFTPLCAGGPEQIPFSSCSSGSLSR